MEGMMQPMTRKQFVLYVLRACKDKACASTSHEITGMTGIDDREVREIVRELRREGYPIGSCSRGFWWITDPGEHREFLESMKGRAFDLLKTVSIQARIPASELAGQLTIALSE
jgi:hypothetical protein